MTFIVDLAHLTVGISTPHYLYLNQATQSLIENGSAKAAAEALNAVEGHSEAIEGCGLPACEKPEELLLHLSQSNAYHRRLAADVRLATEVFDTYHGLSGVSRDERLFLDPSPAMQSLSYDPATYDAARGVAALWSTVNCMRPWSLLPVPVSAFENLMNNFQPLLHMLVGGLMTHFSLIERHAHGQQDRNTELHWFKLMERGTLGLIRQSAGFVRVRIHDLRNGAAITAAPTGPESIALIDGKDIGQVLTVLTGLDRGLEILSSALLKHIEMMSIRTGMMAREVKEQYTSPLIQRFLEVSESRMPDDN